MIEPILQEKILTEEQRKRIENNSTYHPSVLDLPLRYEIIKNQGKKLAMTFCKFAPESRELSLALTNLEQSVMWVNAAIARSETE